MSFTQMRYMNQYDIHKCLINEYILTKQGAIKALKRDTSKDRTDFDVLKAHHKFLWEESEPQTWEEKFARKYYDKLFKEYTIGDLSRYKENKLALRWRTEQEVINGKGQFICANKRCSEEEQLRTWEVNFGYLEGGEKKNALVKIRLCVQCSEMLNYRTRKREIKRLKRKTPKKNKKSSKKVDVQEASTSLSLCEVEQENIEEQEEEGGHIEEESPWANLKPPETKTREEEMDEYLEALLF